MAALTLFSLVSSQVKLFPSYEGTADLTEGYAFADETTSFQLTLRGTCGNRFLPVSVQVTGDVPVEVYKIGYVPVTKTDGTPEDPNYALDSGDFYPDPLYARPANPELDEAPLAWGSMRWEKNVRHTLNLLPDKTVSLWITLNGDGTALPAGDHGVRIRVLNLEDGTVLGEKTYTLHVLPHRLAENRVYYTNWFHCDCLADTYGVELWSERFWALLPHWFTNAARHGMTTLLIPAFTPPLDTPIGRERMRAQLVDITVTEAGAYRFDLTRLERFIKLALESGIRYLEHNHLFSQWGASHAPNIYADTPDGERLIFGWETEAAGEAYRRFIKEYLAALSALSEKLCITDRWVFHISDEPGKNHLENYRKAAELVSPWVGDCPIADAVYAVEFATDGPIQTPVAELSLAPAFADACGSDRMAAEKTDKIPLWLYYTGGTDRKITHTHPRTRVLGAMLYRYGAIGFLHWGYNFYYDRLSVGLFDPLSDPCGYKQMPGAPYLVYPAPDGKPIPSIREMLMGEAMADLRALWRAEELLGREAVNALLTEAFDGPVTNKTLPTETTILTFRKTLHDALAGVEIG